MYDDQKTNFISVHNIPLVYGPVIQTHDLFQHESSSPITTRPGTNPIKILQSKFYAMQFLQTFWLDPKYFQPIKMLEKIV